MCVGIYILGGRDVIFSNNNLNQSFSFLQSAFSGNFQYCNCVHLMLGAGALCSSVSLNLDCQCQLEITFDRKTCTADVFDFLNICPS